MSLRQTTRTFADLLLEIKRLFGDEAGVQLDDGDIRRWATDGQRDIVMLTRALKAKSSITTTAGTATYSFAGLPVHQIASLHYDNVLIPNMAFAEAERTVMAQDPDQEKAGSPVLWYEWAGELTLWPKPDAPGQITLYYTAEPVAFTGDPTQLVALPDRYYTALVQYVLTKCYTMDEDYQASQLAETRYNEILAVQQGAELEAQNMAYPVIQEVY